LPKERSSAKAAERIYVILDSNNSINKEGLLWYNYRANYAIRR
jgi:hypothetical protein